MTDKEIWELRLSLIKDVMTLTDKQCQYIILTHNRGHIILEGANINLTPHSSDHVNYRIFSLHLSIRIDWILWYRFEKFHCL